MQNTNAGIGTYGRVYQYINYSKTYPTNNEPLEKSNDALKFSPKPTKNREWIA